MTPERFRRARAVLDRRQPDLTVVMDDVHKPHNLAAITRSCDAVGVGEVHAVTGGASLRLWRRAASGTQRWVERTRHDGVEEAFAALRARGLSIVAADVGAGTRDYREHDYTRPTALAVGAELDGLSARAREQADARIAIPMQGMVDSLNVSVAVAIILFEAYRQREAAGLYAFPRLDPATYRRLLFEWCHPQVALHCRRHRIAYPELDAAGDIVTYFARGARGPT